MASRRRGSPVRPFIGLEIAGDAPPLQADVTAIAMMASRNLYEALQRFSRLSHILCDAVEVVLTRQANELRLDFVIHPQDRSIMPREAMDPALLIPLGLLGKGMVDAAAIIELRFDCEHPGDETVAHISRLFPIPLRFSCDNYGMVVNWDLSLRQNPYWNPALAQLCEEQVLKELQVLDDNNLIARTRKILLDQLAAGTPQLGKVAALFNITGRQLQRKLKDSRALQLRGELLDDVRLELALRYLQDARMSYGGYRPVPGFPVTRATFVKGVQALAG